MLEQAAEKFSRKRGELNERQLFQQNVADFIEVIPDKGSLYEKNEKGEITTRAINFGQFHKQLSTIAEGARNLSREQKLEIIKRIQALKEEGYFWTKRSASGRNFGKEIEEMGKLIWRE